MQRGAHLAEGVATLMIVALLFSSCSAPAPNHLGSESATPSASTSTTQPPGCVGSAFSASVTTPSRQFVVGETVPVTVKIVNLGSRCYSEMDDPKNASVIPNCLDVTVTNFAGQIAWDYLTANNIACPLPGIATTIPAGWSRSYGFSWPQIQVPPGAYTIDAKALDGDWNGVEVRPATVAILAA